MTNDKKNTAPRKRPSLGRGLAEKAAKSLENRNRRVQDEIDKAAGFKRNK